MRWIAVFLLVFAGGCVSPETVRMDYDADTGRTLYETPGVDILETRSSAMGLQGKQGVSLRITGACRGEGCVPDHLEFIFTREGDSESWMDIRTLAFEMDDETFQWEQQSGRESTVRILPGEFMRVSMTLEQFGHFATGQSVSGSLGGTPFRISYRDREPFRALLTRFGDN